MMRRPPVKPKKKVKKKKPAYGTPGGNNHSIFQLNEAIKKRKKALDAAGKMSKASPKKRSTTKTAKRKTARKRV